MMELMRRARVQQQLSRPPPSVPQLQARRIGGMSAGQACIWAGS